MLENVAERDVALVSAALGWIARHGRTWLFRMVFLAGSNCHMKKI